MEKIKLLLYCTKSKPYLIGRKDAPYKYYLDKGGKDSNMDARDFIHNGKIVAECDFEVEEIECRTSIGMNGIHDEYATKSLDENELLYASKIDEITFINYLKGKNGYAIHIKNLNIFDKPRELNKHYDKLVYEKGGFSKFVALHNAPQNMMYVYDREHPKDKYILISIRPEWLCKILNGEKTIEVRKKVLKEMITDANNTNIY